MNAGKIIATGLIGTTFMTLFSYAVSSVKKRNFKEPDLLAHLEKNPLPVESKEQALPVGWATHYTIGVVWVVVFHLLWKKTKMEPTTTSGLFLGLVSGLTGVFSWAFFLHSSDDPPLINFKRFYAHLILAHLVYSLSATYTARIIAKQDYKNE